jgi:hypothetical protein
VSDKTFHINPVSNYVTDTGWNVAEFDLYSSPSDIVTGRYDHKRITVTGIVNGRKLYATSRISREILVMEPHNVREDAIRMCIQNIMNLALYGKKDAEWSSFTMSTVGEVKELKGSSDLLDIAHFSGIEHAYIEPHGIVLYLKSGETIWAHPKVDFGMHQVYMVYHRK